MNNNLLNKLKNGTDSLKELLLIYLVSALLVALLFTLFEGHNYVESLWWTFITGLTIGYGDIYPVTIAGQVLTVIWAHFMVLFLVPLFIGRIILTALADRNEFTHEEQEDIKSTLARMNIFLDKQKATKPKPAVSKPSFVSRLAKPNEIITTNRKKGK